MKYKYKPGKQFDEEAELNQLLTANQVFTFEEESEISELQEFHESVEPNIEVDR